MNQTRKALGKGLEQLFDSEQLDFGKFEHDIVTSTPDKEIKEIELSEIRSNPYQPRLTFDEDALNELAESIKEHGVVEPIIVKKSIKGYELVAGERRTKASIIAGLKTIPAIVKNFNDEQMMEIALLENIQRENLSPIEEAKAYKTLMEKLDLTQDGIAKKFGKSRSYITNMLGLLNLPEDVQESVLKGKLSMSHARVLSKMENESEILKLASEIVNKNISVHELENISRNKDIRKKNAIKTKEDKNSRYKIYEETMKEVIGSKVNINNNKITISFDTMSDLDRIMEILNIEIGD